MKKSVNPRLLIGIVLIPLVLTSCSENENKEINATISNFNETGNFEKEDSNSSVTNSSSEKHKEKKITTPDQRKKLIKRGDLSLRSKHIEKSKARLDQALQSLDGYYDNEHFSKSDYEFRYSLKIRVPAKNFGKILQLINGGDDEIISKDIQTEDVSGEYHDLEARLSSKRAYLKRYEELLTKANTMTEMLQIEDEIRQLIEEIESQEARLHFLDDQVGYSTLDIELYKTINHPEVSAEEPGFWENAKNSIASGWAGVVVLFLGLLSIWPLLLILIPAGIFGYRKLKNPKK